MYCGSGSLDMKPPIAVRPLGLLDVVVYYVEEREGRGVNLLILCFEANTDNSRTDSRPYTICCKKEITGLQSPVFKLNFHAVLALTNTPHTRLIRDCISRQVLLQRRIHDRARDHDVWEFVAHAAAERYTGEGAAVGVAHDEGFAGEGICGLEERGDEGGVDGMEDAHAVGGETEAGAHGADGFGVGFVYVDGVGGEVLADEVVGAKAADAGADDEDLHGGVLWDLL